MNGVSIIPAPSLEGTRLAFVLVEDRLGHYDEFREFFVRSFALDHVGLAVTDVDRSIGWYQRVGWTGHTRMHGAAILRC